MTDASVVLGYIDPHNFAGGSIVLDAALSRRAIEDHIAGPMGQTPIEVEPWDDSSWAQGAAALVLATPFDLEGFAGRQAELVLARLHGEVAG